MPVNVPTSTTVVAPTDRDERRQEAALVLADVHPRLRGESFSCGRREPLADVVDRMGSHEP